MDSTIAERLTSSAKASGWSSATAHNRAQVLYYIAENLSSRADEFTARLRSMGQNARDAKAEVEAALAFLFFGAVAIGAIRGEESANRGSGGVLGDERERAGREGGEDNAREPAGDGGKAGCTDHVRRGRGRGGYRC